MRLLPFFACLLFLAAGGLRMRAEMRWAQEAESLRLDGAQGRVSGTVDSVQDDGERLVLILRQCEVRWEAETARLRRVQVYLDKAAVRGGGGAGVLETETGEVSEKGIRTGNLVEAAGTWDRFDRARNPGGYDSWLYARARKLDARMYAEWGEVMEGQEFRYREWLRRISARAGRILEQITSGTDTGIYKAAVLGDKADLDGRIQKMYQRNGIAHLLAISGLHMSLLGMGAYALVRRLGAGLGLAGAAGAVFVISYGVMTGGSPSVVRASVMLLCGFGAAYLGRTYDLLSVLGLAAILLLWDSPYLVTQAGVQLSFGAVLGIGGLNRSLESCFVRPGRWEILGKALSASLCVQLVTTPVILYHYFQLPLYGVLLNLLVIPFMGYVVGSGLAGIVLGVFSLQAGRFAVGAGHYILAFYELLCQVCERIPGSNLVLGRPEPWQICAYYLILALIWAGMERRWLSRRRAAAGLVLVFALLLPLPVRGLEATFLDVGQGDGICLRTGRYTMLVDGGSTDEKRLGEYFLEPFLKSEAVTDIDYAWVSHGDQDHISGLIYLLEQGADIQIHNLMLPILGKEDEAYKPLCALVKEQGGQIYWIKSGDVLNAGNLRITCLYPGNSDTAEDRNEQSMVLKAAYGAFTMLLTGDMSEKGETTLINDPLMSKELSGTQVLKLAHHGSRTSNSEAWLKSVNPIWAVVSYGKSNSYGHPHQEVQDRIQSQGITLWETAKHGAVKLWTNGSKLKWSSFSGINDTKLSPNHP